MSLDDVAGPEPLPAGVDLEPGERVLWTGRPEQVPWWFGEDDVNQSLYGLVPLAGVSFLAILAAASGGAVAFALLVVLLVVPFGLYPVAGRVVHRRMRIRRSVYVVTDRRLIATRRVIALGGRVTTAALLYELPTPVVEFGSVFAEPAVMQDLRSQHPFRRRGIYYFRYMLWPAAAAPPPALIGIADPEAVCDLIDDAELALEAAAETASDAAAETRACPGQGLAGCDQPEPG